MTLAPAAIDTPVTMVWLIGVFLPLALILTMGRIQADVEAATPHKPLATVMFRINNASTTFRYTPAGHSMFKGMVLERREGRVDRRVLPPRGMHREVPP